MSGGGLADVDNYKYTREHDEGGGYRKTTFSNTGCIRVIWDDLSALSVWRVLPA